MKNHIVKTLNPSSLISPPSGGAGGGLPSYLIVFLLCLAAVLPANAWAQQAEPSERLTKMSSMGFCTLYSFNYPSVNNAGERIVLSSALIAWTPTDRQESDSIESIHIYSHATIGADTERPSSEGFSKEQSVLQTLPKRNYTNIMDKVSADYVGRCIIIAPDYEGYGVTKDLPHPYLSQRLTAQQMLDGINYGLELYRKQMSDQTADNPLLPIKGDWRTFAIGYSQGAAVTLALQRLMEEKGLAEQLHFCGSICGDGPYDLIETMRYYFEDDGTSYGVETDHRKGTSTYPVVIPLIIKGMCATHPAMSQYRIEDLLSQQLLDTGVLTWIDSKQYTTSEMAKLWYDQLQSGLDNQGRHYTPEQMAELFSTPRKNKVTGHLDRMFIPAAYAYMNSADSMSVVPREPATAAQALHRALADNSVISGWEPQHRIQFYHSKADMVVPYGNYLSFRNVHPDGENTIYRLNDTFSSSDHMDAATLFFLQLCISNSFASDFQWLCETLTPTGIDIKRAIQPLTPDGNNWSTLDGRRLTTKPTTKGIYIYNNKKVVIR